MSNDADTDPAEHGTAHGSWINAVLLGLAGGFIASLVWLLIVVGTGAIQAYLVIGFGLVVAFGVHVGAHRPGRRAAITSVVITVVVMVFATYFVERYLVVKWFTDNGASKSIPLVPYLDWMASVVRHAFTSAPSLAIYTTLALVAAGWFGYHGFEPRDSRDRRG